jgi:xanthine dehydrogenase molybdopterin-binding subunit B
VYEQIVHDEAGTPITASLMDYTIPKAFQVPELDVRIVEVPSTIGPYGAKPVGEPPIIPGGACIANAVHNACGAGDVATAHLRTGARRDRRPASWRGKLLVSRAACL